jgi:hypothetical protein
LIPSLCSMTAVKKKNNSLSRYSWTASDWTFWPYHLLVRGRTRLRLQ